MNKGAIIAIDDNSNWLATWPQKLEEDGLLIDHDYYPIQPLAATTDEYVLNCEQAVDKLLQECSNIVAAFVDIVLVGERADQPQLDRSGLDVAESLRPLLPQVPIIGMTLYTSDHRLIADLFVDSRIDGLIPKNLLNSNDFRRNDLLAYIESAKNRLRKARGHTCNYRRSEPDVVSQQSSRFKVQNSPHCEAQIHQIGRDRMFCILREFFEGGAGTISYVRPGYSGSHLFKVSVMTEQSDGTRTNVHHWVVKVFSDRAKAAAELERNALLSESINKKWYPIVRKDSIVECDGKYAIAFEMIADAKTLWDYIQDKSNATMEVRGIIENQLGTFLTELYGQISMERDFLWSEDYYRLGQVDQAKALAYLTDIASSDIQWSFLTTEHIDTVKNLIETDGGSIKGLDGNIPTCKVHGDLHSKNIMVSTEDRKSLVFLDFANTGKSHGLRDFAKLEVDMLMLAMDGHRMRDRDWSRLEKWEQCLPLFQSGAETLIDDSGCDWTSSTMRCCEIIITIRRVAHRLFPELQADKGYSIAVLFYLIKYITYPDVSDPKKVLAIKIAYYLYDHIIRK